MITQNQVQVLGKMSTKRSGAASAVVDHWLGGERLWISGGRNNLILSSSEFIGIDGSFQGIHQWQKRYTHLPLYDMK